MIRPATEHDLAELLAMVRELAEFESLSDQCVCTEADLHKVLFAPGATVFDTVAVADDGSLPARSAPRCRRSASPKAITCSTPRPTC